MRNRIQGVPEVRAAKQVVTNMEPHAGRLFEEQCSLWGPKTHTSTGMEFAGMLIPLENAFVRVLNLHRSICCVYVRILEAGEYYKPDNIAALAMIKRHKHGSLKYTCALATGVLQIV